MLISPRDLVISEKKARYLRELQEHLEDSGVESTLGTPKELIQAFNMYATPKRNLKIAFIVFIALLSLSTSWLIAHGELWDNNFIENHESGSTPIERTIFAPIVGPLVILGLVFYLPVGLLLLPPLYLGIDLFHVDVFENNVFETYFAAVPFLVGIFWASLTTFLLFRPAWTRSRKDKNL